MSASSSAEALINFAADKLRRALPRVGDSRVYVGSYVRELPVNLERMFENAIDGEHLPYLHRSTFSHLDILDSGLWGWRAKTGLHPRGPLTDFELELVLDRDEGRWTVTTLAGLGKGTEVVTHASAIDEHSIRIVVDFYVPKLPSFLKAFYLDYYRKTYERLYDEDLSMMSERQASLDYLRTRQRAPSEDDLLLGTERELLAELPRSFEWKKHRYLLNRVDGQLLAYSAICPHMLAPLERTPLDGHVVECPWHAYRFDVRTGANLSGQSCRMKAGPEIWTDPETGKVYARSAAASQG